MTQQQAVDESTQTDVPVIFGVVLPSLPVYADLVHAVAASPFTSGMEFSFSRPLYKATPAIQQALTTARNAREKFDAYFRHGILDEGTRATLAQAFRAQYLARHPRSEASDLYLASGDVLGVQVELHAPLRCPQPDAVLEACAQFSHDATALAAARAGEPIERALRLGTLKLFLDEPANRRRRADPAVAALSAHLNLSDPCVIELWVSGALPGLFSCVVEPIARAAGGGLVVLDA